VSRSVRSNRKAAGVYRPLSLLSGRARVAWTVECFTQQRATSGALFMCKSLSCLSATLDLASTVNQSTQNKPPTRHPPTIPPSVSGFEGGGVATVLLRLIASALC
jgi:hypothetical protein